MQLMLTILLVLGYSYIFQFNQYYKVKIWRTTKDPQKGKLLLFRNCFYCCTFQSV